MKLGGKWRTKLGVAVAVAIGILAALAAAGALPFLGDPAPDAVPTVRVERESIARRISGEGNLEAVKATPIVVPPTLNGAVRIAWLIEDGTQVRSGDPVVRLDPTDMEKELLDAGDALRSADLKVGKERAQRLADLENLERDAGLADLELEQAQQFQKKDSEIYSRHEIVESEIDGELAQARRDHAGASRRSREKLSDADLELLEIERRKAGFSIEQAEEGLAALVITAPHDGLVVLAGGRGPDPWRVGDTVWRGATLAELPDLGEVKAEVYVLEADAGGLAEGAAAEVMLEAHPETAYPATVTRVDSLAKPRLRGSPVQYFAVELKLAETLPAVMKPGQRVRAWIRLDTVADALVVPRQAIFEKDGTKVVWRRRPAGGGEAGFEAVPVELGAPTLGRVVVTSGLAPGDEVALVDPTRRAAAAERGDGDGGEAASGALPYAGGGGR